ncbi:MAG: putative ABC transporter, permease protein [Planctomycetota bacterium]|nr:MAG: putative ABC transporter, permease protein [Planctomycetota bacterium]
MSYLAFRNLWQQKIRLALSVAGVALALMLIILLNGFLSGIYAQVTAYLDNSPADLVIAQEGVTNLLSATSLLPAGVPDQVRSVPGVAGVTPIVSQFTIFDLHEEKVVAYMVGYEPGQGGGPWQMKDGRFPTSDDEVVLDWVMAANHSIQIGDMLDILDETFTVVGLSDDTNSWMASFFFVEKRAAERLLLTPDATSFVLLTLTPDADINTVTDRLNRRLSDVEIVPVETMRQNDLDLLVQVFAAPLQLMVTIAFAVGTAILGMVIYTATVERTREYGVLKAVGAKNYHLYWLVAQQGLVTAVLGALIGIGLAWLAAQTIMYNTPKFLIVLEPKRVLLMAGSGLLMGLLAALLPARLVARLDPAQVFRK